MSPDGRFVTFDSTATNLVPGSLPPERRRVYVRDLVAGTTDLATTNDPEYESLRGSISADGRFVAFEAGDTNGVRGVFVVDRVTDTVERMSVDSAGSQGNGNCDDPVISASGQVVAFLSRASNLVSDDTNDTGDVFVHERTTGVTERMSVRTGGAEGDGDSDLYRPAISDDGRFVAFVSDASNLVDHDSTTGAFVHDRLTGETERVSVSTGGEKGDLKSKYVSISGDGRYVAFTSFATNLVPDDTNDYCRINTVPINCPDVFVRDRVAGTTERVSVSSAGVEANGSSGELGPPSISLDGRFVAFNSGASNLVPDDVNGLSDIFIRDRLLGITSRLREAPRGPEETGDEEPSISADGAKIVFRPEQVTEARAARAAARIEPAAAVTAPAGFSVATDCSRAVCGDATLTARCEECDDGNVVDGDGCSASCRSELVSGGGRARSDCLHEMLAVPIPPTDHAGIPRNRLECTDDDPQCDVGTPGDGQCVFRLALCLNASEARRRGCSARDVERVQLVKPRHANPRGALETEIRDSAETKLADLGGTVGHECIAPSAARGRLCSADGECDSAPGIQDGVCGDRLVRFIPPFTERDRCSGFMNLRVPLSASGGVGRRTLKLRASRAGSAPTVVKRTSDVDTFTLICHPRSN